MTTTKYIVCDESACDVVIEADSPQDAADAYVASGDWAPVDGWSVRHHLYVAPAVRITYEAFEGANGWYVAPVGEDGTHRQPSDGDLTEAEARRAAWAEWVPDGDSENYYVVRHPTEPPCDEGAAHEWTGGDVRGNGGGVLVTERCTRCGVDRLTDTWATDPQNGQPYKAIRYLTP